jgi:hypothetical protein
MAETVQLREELARMQVMLMQVRNGLASAAITTSWSNRPLGKPSPHSAPASLSLFLFLSHSRASSFLRLD